MSEKMFNFPSYSTAAEAYDLLRNNRISTTIVRTSPGYNRQCGYSVRVSGADARQAESLIANNGLYYRYLNR
ncbi:MAG: DUF3343 domain-containing protein [Firmicutes bacterium]|nr:DUF3343 domain-containing protein [Bacillota bacterium]